MTMASQKYLESLDAKKEDCDLPVPNIEWTNLGPLNSDAAMVAGDMNQGRVNAISASPLNPDEILVGSQNAGIWRSDDGGDNWHITTDDEGYSLYGVASFVRHPTLDNVVYASTGIEGGGWGGSRHAYSMGVIMSTNGGESWVPTGLVYNPAIFPWGTSVGKLAIDPNSTETNTILYCVHGSTIKRWQGNFMADGEWSVIYDDATTFNSNIMGTNKNLDVEVDLNGTAWFSNYIGLFSYENGVVNQEDLQLLPPFDTPSSCTYSVDNVIYEYDKVVRHAMNIEINAVGDIVVLAVLEEGYSDGSDCKYHWGEYLYHLAPGSSNWSNAVQIGSVVPLNKELYAAYNNSFIVPQFAIDPNNWQKIYIEAGNRKIRRSENFGGNFESVPSDFNNHIDVRAIESLRSGNDVFLFVGTDGGISKLVNNEPLQMISGEGLSLTQFYGVGVTEDEANLVMGGAQDGSINYYYRGDWYEVNPQKGDNGDVLLGDIKATGAGYEKIPLVRENQHFVYWNEVNVGNGINVSTSSGSKHIGSWINPLHWNPSKPKEFFVGARKLFLGDFSSINSIFTPPGNKDISSVTVSRKNKDVVYCSTDGSYYAKGTAADDGIWRGVRTGNSWNFTDITNDLRNKSHTGSTLIGLGTPITDIAIDPMDENRIWITRGKFSEGEKVFYSPDAGENWVNITADGLPNLPCTAIAYQEGSNDRLYVGTDNGVFYRDNNMECWVRYGVDGPQNLINDLEINHCGSKLVVATYGRGIWEADLLPAIELVIDADVVWGSDMKILGDVRITPGHKLTINNGAVINFAQSVRVFVERGAVLEVSNATLTNGCGGLWGGIQVWGDSSKDKFSPAQGKLIVRHNAIIEYANNAVKLGKDYDWPISFTGGILKASNATFRNNRRSVEFLKYDFPNRSSFFNCDFIYSEPFPNGKKPMGHVSMWAVTEVPFVSCNFKNVNPEADYGELGYGIWAEDANFSLLGCLQGCHDDPCCVSDPCVFTHLDFGVRSEKIYAANTYTLLKCRFNACKHSVYNAGTDFFKVELCDFKLGMKDSNLKFYGVENIFGTQFSIQDNKFSLSSGVNSSYHCYGTVSNTIGKDNNEIYNNYFYDLWMANYAIGNNVANIKNDDGYYDGLAYVCNKQVGSRWAINVHGGIGIRTWQLDVKEETNALIAAGNTFRNSFQKDFRNKADKNILYFWADKSFEKPLKLTPFKVKNRDVASDGNSCPSKWKLDIKKTKKKLKELYKYHDEKWRMNKSFLKDRLDGNQSEVLKAKVAAASQNDASLMVELSSISPYLSREIVALIVEESAFSGDDLFDILSANAEAYWQANVSALIKDKGLLSDAQIEMLDKANFNTQRSQVEALLSAHKAKRDYFAGMIIQRLLVLPDSLKSNETDQELDTWLDNFGSLSMAYAKVDWYFSQNMVEEATGFLKNIPVLYDLTEEGKSELDDLIELYEFLIQLELNHRTLYQLNDEELIVLLEMTKTSNRAGLKAKNILSFFYGVKFDENWNTEIEQSETNSGSNTSTTTTGDEEKNTLISITPNPVSDEFSIKYLAKSIYGNDADIYVLDGHGNMKFTAKIQQQEEQFGLNAAGWSPGTYFCIYQTKTGYRKIIPFNVSDY